MTGPKVVDIATKERLTHCKSLEPKFRSATVSYVGEKPTVGKVSASPLNHRLAGWCAALMICVKAFSGPWTAHTIKQEIRGTNTAITGLYVGKSGKRKKEKNPCQPTNL